jgi:hypothetical protein
MQFSRSIVLFALVAALGTTSAMAQNASPTSAAARPAVPSADTPSTSGADDHGAPAFADISKDGKYITRGDVPKDVPALKELRAHFGEADQNHDGKVDKGEYETYIGKSSQRPQQR